MASNNITMLQLAIVLLVAKCICGLDKNFELFDINAVDFIEGNDLSYYDVPTDGDTLWVLTLNNDDLAVRLRAGKKEDKNDFDTVVGPLIERMSPLRLQRRTLKTEKPQSPMENQDNGTADDTKKNGNNKIKHELLKIINKFALSASEPDTLVSDNSEGRDSPALSLYFKGPYTSLIVKMGLNQWHYFLTPSPLPTWFNEPHTTEVKREGNEMYVDIPDDVKENLFETLLRVGHKLFGYPV